MAEKKAAKKTAKKAGAKKASSAKKAAPAKKAATSAKKKASSAKRPTHEQIQKRAYEIHEREGGHHEDNWLRAERELGGG